MKKLIAILAILAMAIPCFGATATWDVVNPDGVPILGFSLEMARADNPTVVVGRWNPTVATQEIPDSKFLPGVSYVFRVLAYNSWATPSAWSQPYTYLVEGEAYQPDAPVTPPDVVLPPPPPAPGGMVLESAQYTFVPVP